MATIYHASQTIQVSHTRPAILSNMKRYSRSSSGNSSIKKDYNFGNVVVKYLLFLFNTAIWLLGAIMLALGIYIEKQGRSFEVMLGSALSSPAIISIFNGSFLFILGLCGCLGTLLELFFLLVTYSALLLLVILGELILVLYIYLKKDGAYGALKDILSTAIPHYFDDADLRNIIDLIQSQLLKCCGIRSPNDWERNPYFNCSSVAFQRCSVPFSCCVLEEGQVINLQCGYRTLDNSTAVQDFVQDNMYVVGGVLIGLLIFQVVNVFLAIDLAVAIRKQKKIINQQRKDKKELERILAEP